MKKLAAELELKLRNIYFDRIDPQKVEGIVNGIYEVIRDLDDIIFLIKHAKVLFPERSEDVVAATVRDNLVQLQNKLAQERQAAIDGLERALKAYYAGMLTEKWKVARIAVNPFLEIFALRSSLLYRLLTPPLPPSFLLSDTEPVEVKKATVDAAEFFKKSEEIKNLAADVNIHFPADFLDLVAKEVRRSFVKAKRGQV